MRTEGSKVARRGMLPRRIALHQITYIDWLHRCMMRYFSRSKSKIKISAQTSRKSKRWNLFDHVGSRPLCYFYVISQFY
jgi:hypothetical protein